MAWTASPARKQAEVAFARAGLALHLGRVLAMNSQRVDLRCGRVGHERDCAQALDGRGSLARRLIDTSRD